MNREQKRLTIITLKKEGLSAIEISKRVGVHRSGIYKIWNKYSNTSSIQDSKRSGRPSILTPRKKRNILMMLKRGEEKTATGISKKISATTNDKISRQTVSRTLHSFGYVARVKRKKPLLSSQQMKRRFQWAKDHEKWDIDDWKNVIWSDETKFNLLNSDGKEYYWTNKPGTFSPESVKSTLKFGGGSIMIWGCMTWEGLGFSCKIDGNMDGELYSEILKGELMDTYQYYNFDKATTIFQHDNDPKHKSKVANSTLSKLGLQVLPWPAQSPDMNPIEHFWNYLDSELRKRMKQFPSKNSLWEELQDILKEKHMDYCQKLISTMPQRVKDLKKARGGSTKW